MTDLLTSNSSVKALSAGSLSPEVSSWSMIYCFIPSITLCFNDCFSLALIGSILFLLFQLSRESNNRVQMMIHFVLSCFHFFIFQCQNNGLMLFVRFF